MDHQPSTTSLKQYLTVGIPVPTAKCLSKNPTNRTNACWPELSFVGTWSDFNLHTIETRYGNILATDMDLPPTLVSVPDLCASELNDGQRSSQTCSLPQCVLQWLTAAIQPAVEEGKKQLGASSGRTLVRETSKTICRDEKSVVPSYVLSLSGRPTQYLVVGQSKHAAQWRADKVQDGQMHSMNSVFPLRHLANVCEIAKVPYGFLLTENELAVCRFAFTPGGLMGKRGTLADCHLQSIPLTNHGVGSLTAPLALWYLTMLSLHEGTRGIIAQGLMTPITPAVGCSLPLDTMMLAEDVSTPKGSTMAESSPALDDATMTDGGASIDGERIVIERSQRLTFEQYEHMGFDASFFNFSSGI